MSKRRMKLRAQVAVEDGKEFDALVGQVLESGDNNVQPNKMARKVPKPMRKIRRLTPS